MGRIAVLITVLIQLCFAQTNQSKIPLSYAAKHYLSTSTFTDITKYNSYDFAEDPLGRFDIDTISVELKAGYRFLNSSVNGPLDTAGTYNGFMLPVITLRPSSSALLSFNYLLNSIKSDTLSLPLHQFGFTTLGQTRNSIFKGGITGQGFIGKEKQDNGATTRTVLGLQDIGICLGSKISSQVNLGFYAHAAFFLDTLFNSDEDLLLQERFASVKLPQLDVTADINIPGISDKADISYTYAKQHFVYTQKVDNNSLMNTFHDIAGDNDSEHQWDADPIVNDSMSFALQNMTKFDVNNNIRLLPSFTIGYMYNSFTRMKPGKDNNPLSYEGEKNGYDWQTSSFRFGIGSTVQLFDLSSIWVEFSHSSLQLTLGKEYSDTLKDSESKGFYHLGIGSQFNFARIPAFNISESIDLALTIGYLYDQRNDLLSNYRGDAFSHIQPMTVNSQLFRYTPWVSYKEKITSSGIQTGLHTSFNDNTFITDIYFICSSQSITGNNEREGNEVEAGLDLTLNIKTNAKK